MASIKAVFSDIDGTLVHYEESPEALALPASKTGRCGYISKETLELIQQIRANAVKFVLVSGVRYSTFAARLPFMPMADAYVIENGGRIFYPIAPSKDEGERAPSAEELVEDMDWRKQLESSCGGPEMDALPPQERQGPLWEVLKSLVKDGVQPDTASYFTMMRIDTTKAADWPALLSRHLNALPSSLSYATNFGLVDIMPAGSGKANVARYLASKFKIPPACCAALCDDDNDIAMAKWAEAGAWVTQFSADSMQAAALADPEHFHVANSLGVKAAEECLNLMLQRC